jgi:hypothetical protein
MPQVDHDYKTALNIEIANTQATVQHDPLADETTQANLDLLVAVREYEVARSNSRQALKEWEKDKNEAHSDDYKTSVDKRTATAAKLQKAVKRMNVLEGKKPYAERNVLGVRWTPSKNGLPYRFDTEIP